MNIQGVSEGMLNTLGGAEHLIVSTLYHINCKVILENTYSHTYSTASEIKYV